MRAEPPPHLPLHTPPPQGHLHPANSFSIDPSTQTPGGNWPKTLRVGDKGLCGSRALRRPHCRSWTTPARSLGDVLLLPGSLDCQDMASYLFLVHPWPSACTGRPLVFPWIFPESWLCAGCDPPSALRHWLAISITQMSTVRDLGAPSCLGE